MLVSSVDPRDQTGGHPSQLPRLLPRCPRCGRGTRDHWSRRLRDFGVGRDRATRQNLRALRLRPAQRSGPGPTSRQRPQRAVESPWSRHVRVSSGNRFVQGSEWTCVSIEVTLARIKRCRIAATVALAAIAIGAHSADHPRLPYAQHPSSGTTAAATNNPTGSHEGEPLRRLTTSRKDPAIPARSASGASKRATPGSSGSNQECLVTGGSSPSSGAAPQRRSIVGSIITKTPAAAKQ